MEPRATDKLLDEHFDQLSDSYSDTELGDHLDGTAWKLRHVRATPHSAVIEGRTLGHGARAAA